MSTMHTSDATVARSFDHNVHYLSADRVMRPRVIPRILLIDDDPIFGKIMLRAAVRVAAPLDHIQRIEELSNLRLREFDVAVIDYDLGEFTGVELALYVDHHVPMPIVLVSRTTRSPDPMWSDSIHEFIHKDAGPFAIIDAAFEAHEIARLHLEMRRNPRRKVG